MGKAIDHLETVCNHADEDCPQEYRSKWYDISIADARAFINEVTNVRLKPKFWEDK